MSEVEVSLNDNVFVAEVRDALAGVDATKIPDGTITQVKDRLVEDLLNNLVSDSVDQDQFDNAAIFWSAELAFDAWMTFTRLRDREIEAYVDPRSYRQQLRDRTDRALYVLGTNRPPTIPNQVVTVQHDGEKRRVDLNQEWVADS